MQISKNKIILLFMFFSINFIFAREVLIDDSGVLSNSSFKKISKWITETSNETHSQHTIAIVQDFGYDDAQELCDEMLDDISSYERNFEGTLLLILIGSDGKLSSLSMSFLGRNTSKVLNSRRTDSIIDLSLDFIYKDYAKGINMYLSLLELLFDM
ncbi:MAG: TPM domain-containing protein [Treponema sp.]